MNFNSFNATELDRGVLMQVEGGGLMLEIARGMESETGKLLGKLAVKGAILAISLLVAL